MILLFRQLWTLWWWLWWWWWWQANRAI